jgi:hypothetical protein
MSQARSERYLPPAPMGADGPYLVAILDVLDNLHDLLAERLPPRRGRASAGSSDEPGGDEQSDGAQPIEEPATPDPGPEATPIAEPAPARRRTPKKTTSTNTSSRKA